LNLLKALLVELQGTLLQSQWTWSINNARIMLDILIKPCFFNRGIAEGLILRNYKLFLTCSPTSLFLACKRRMVNLTLLIFVTITYFNQIEFCLVVELLLWFVLTFKFYILALITILLWLFSSLVVACLCISISIYHLPHRSMWILIRWL
jgi:hypothetical protein